jgi:hypothetical protein
LFTGVGGDVSRVVVDAKYPVTGRFFSQTFMGCECGVVSEFIAFYFIPIFSSFFGF